MVDIYNLLFQAATIAKELLNGGVSPTADAIAKTTAKINNSSSKNSNIPVQPLPQLPTSGKGKERVYKRDRISI